MKLAGNASSIKLIGRSLAHKEVKLDLNRVTVSVGAVGLDNRFGCVTH